jgi:hypothetical protein
METQISIRHELSQMIGISRCGESRYSERRLPLEDWRPVFSLDFFVMPDFILRITGRMITLEGRHIGF